MEIELGLMWAEGNQEVTEAEVRLAFASFETTGGLLAKATTDPARSGLASLELLKLVTKEDGFDK